MILRRVIEHVKAQHWTAVFLDFVIVVMGVFMGIQLGNWNERQADAREYAEALERVRSEIDANLKTLDLSDDDIGAVLPVVRGALDALVTCSDDAETLNAVNAGVALFWGTAGIHLRVSELDALTSDPRLLAQESPAVRHGLSDLKFITDIVERSALYYEEYPQDGRVEKIHGLTPGPRTVRSVTYLGIAYDNNQRPLRLDEPVSVACRNTDLVNALWAWDRTQSNLPLLTAKMRAAYKDALNILDTETKK
ncbi:MAG: hypothetical protein R3C60_10240 [Parvularculaceae bacterium]